VRTADGRDVRGRALVMATGIVANPRVPDFPGRDLFQGTVRHSVEYRRPEPFAGRRVLVVGAGNSAGEISVELAEAGADVTVAVRSGARVVPLTVLGLPAQYVSVALSRLPRQAQRRVVRATSRISALVRGPSPLPPPRETPCANIPLIGFHFVDAIRAGRIRLQRGIAAFTPAGLRFADGSEAAFDDVILATGYRAAVAPLGPLIQVDDCGFAARRDRVVSIDHPDLFFVGHNYDMRGGLRNIAQDARLVARLIGGRPPSPARPRRLDPVNLPS
jgi:putative flavoprotein involved in K+ transport